MINNLERIGNFTSSNIFRLMTNDRTGKFMGEKALTYIEEKNLERKLGRSLEKETYSRDMAWGIFLEQRVMDLLGLEYQMTTKQTDLHPTISYWSGSKDLIVEGVKVSDIKCYQLKNFAKYTDALLSQDCEKIKKEFPKEYWQLISNAIIAGLPKAEGITYMPYASEIPEIREMAHNYEGADQWKYRFIAESDIDTLAYLPDNCFYKNLNLFEFEVPEIDSNALTERVELAGKLLEPLYLGF